MDIVSEHLHNLTAQSGSPLWSGYVNMLKNLESVFSSSKHWVLEFLQNAEDAKARRISIRLGKDSLKILNDGETFTNENFFAICDVNSRKLPSLGFRGYIGIGFKSIFRITDCVQIHSGNLHFSFDRKHWSDSQRMGVPISRWPWEILPIEIPPTDLKEGYTTCFSIPLESVNGQEVLEEIGGFLASYEFPKEAILLLKNVQVIEVQTPELSYKIEKEVIESKTLIIDKRKSVQESVIIRKQVTVQKYSEEARYLVLKVDVKVPDNIRQDADTERVRRSEITEREIGVVFSLDSDSNLQTLSGKLAGVYSFLPVEGEQTGLPFGIFGDFIPRLGRDLIQYGVKWNHWMCTEVADFLKQVVLDVFTIHPRWKFFPAELLARVQYSSISGPGKEFWDIKLRIPVKEFLDTGAVYPDESGANRKLSELMVAADAVIQVLGKENLETITGKKLAHELIQWKIRSQVDVIDEEDLIKREDFLSYLKGQPNKLAVVPIESVYKVLYTKEVLESLKGQPEELAKTYHRIAGLNEYRIKGRPDKHSRPRDSLPLTETPFVLADDGEFYPPDQVVTVDTDLADIPEFLKVVLQSEKKQLHHKIAQDKEAVKQLEKCGLEIMNKQTVNARLEKVINSIKSAQGCPNSWKYPDDLITATLFLASGDDSVVDQLVAEDGTLKGRGNLFVPGTPVDWMLLWQSNLVHGFQPIHNTYMNKQQQERLGLTEENALVFFERLGVHGFNREKDKSLIEASAYAVSKKQLIKDGHNPADVTQHDKLGYDLECQGHCNKVFEIKGMSEPRDIPLEPSEFATAQQKKQDYILVCVYNLPAHPDKVVCKKIADPAFISRPVEKAVIPKERWLKL